MAAAATSQTHYGYDTYGNVTSQLDARGNTTNYEYNSIYDHAYHTKITYPPTSVSHIESFGYDFNSGELTSSTDQNGQTTSYIYNDPLGRLTETDYPCTVAGCGKTTISYSDNAPTPSITTTKKISSSLNYVTTSTMDGMGHVTRVALPLIRQEQTLQTPRTTAQGECHVSEPVPRQFGRKHVLHVRRSGKGDQGNLSGLEFLLHHVRQYVQLRLCDDHRSGCQNE